ncbi:esterase-like activity of phytase family protein [Gloeocapsopsis crepidinum LEGE 06123]|uniref:Esterase-like activity of phytase family protein n=1 Tax=Gloeocapsopsis crepidinum LEGE 06123 TaxID=588587 RepID=A0ABR9UQJ4_9CHRO|nr:esterase-like activity of phytase family protein [Gloeocapsopsis crepidinum]MBE9190539.1 esterase-like activity of phytase family protein [Gloeocapsopsis crepidinum LEGE 06123]
MSLNRKLLQPITLVFFCLVFIILVVTRQPTPAVPVTAINFLGEATILTGLSFQGTEFGGLSGITYDSTKDIYYGVSDDRSERAPARFYTLKINLEQGLQQGDVTPLKVTTLLNAENQPFAKYSIDAEGIAVTDRQTVFVSSEGDAQRLINPFIKEFSLASGKELRSLPIPERFLPTASRDRGIRNNNAFESLTVTPNQQYLFSATENALLQDEPIGQPDTSSPCRILQYDLRSGVRSHEYLYITETVPTQINLPKFMRVGLVDLLAIDNNGNFISLERAFTGLGYSIRLYAVSLAQADDISDIDSLRQVDLSSIKPVNKRLLLDLKTLKNIALDNIEGLTLGSELTNGQRSLILVSDNNFQPAQRTQFLAFTIPSQFKD